MAKCSYCGTGILFGGKTEGTLRFCNARCQGMSTLMSMASQLPPETIEESVRLTHSGNCPRCNGRGPVDVHTSHRVWSALLVTSWSSRPQVCCHTCGWKSKLNDTLYCLLLGWWGFPWGLIMTPVQVGRNLFGLTTSPDVAKPSESLRTLVRVHMARSLLQKQQVRPVPPLLPR